MKCQVDKITNRLVHWLGKASSQNDKLIKQQADQIPSSSNDKLMKSQMDEMTS